jgi:hypothetical protein
VWERHRKLQQTFADTANERRRLGLWIQEWEAANSAAKEQRREEHDAESSVRSVRRFGSLRQVGKNLKEVSQAWAVLAEIAAAASDLVDVQNDPNASDETADDAYEALEELVFQARQSGLLSTEGEDGKEPAADE